jgi:hypothetical protein
LAQALAAWLRIEEVLGGFKGQIRPVLEAAAVAAFRVDQVAFAFLGGALRRDFTDNIIINAWPPLTRA